MLSVVLSALLSLLLYLFYEISIVNLFLLYYLQTIILIPIHIIRAFRFDFAHGLMDLILTWPLMLLIFVFIVESAITYFGYNRITMGEEYLLLGAFYVILGIFGVLYGKKVSSAFELSFLKSIVYRRTGIILLSFLMSSALMSFGFLNLSIIFFIIFQCVFELFILYHSIQIRREDIHGTLE